MPPNPAPRVMAAAAAHATTAGTLFARLPEMQRALSLSEAEFGLILLALPAGVAAGSVVVPGLIERTGPRQVLILGLPLLGVTMLPVALAGSPLVLALAIGLFGLIFASGNLAFNVEADRIEAAQDVRILNRCHGWWAVGFLLASLVAAPLIGAEIGPPGHFALLAVALAVLVPVALRDLPISQPRAPAADASRRKLALPGRSTFLIGAFAAAGIVLEGVARSWSVIFVRDTFGTADWVAALALPALIGAMTAARFAGDAAVGRFGDVAVARGLSAILALGILAAAAAPSPLVAIAGFALIGLGMATSMPQGFAASARRGDRPAAEAMGAFAMFGATLSFLSPSAFGALAEIFGLRTAFHLLLPLALVAIVFAGQLGRREARLDGTRSPG